MSAATTSDPELRRVFVLDTSVLLADPGALGRFGEHDVVLPLVVISELEGKRHHPELGWFARETLRLLDDLRVQERSGATPRKLDHALGGTIKPLRLVEADTNPDLTSAFGGPADMGGPAAGLVTGRK